MRNKKRSTPYGQKGRKPKNSEEKLQDLDERIVDLEMAQIQTDTARNRARLELMTEEELKRVQQSAAQNALDLFNKLLEELARRVPAMTDEVLSASLLSVWDKIGTKKN